MPSDEKKVIPSVTIPIVNYKIELRWLSLLLLIVQNTVLVLTMRITRTSTSSEELYFTSTAVIVAETLKLLACIVLLRLQAPSWSVLRADLRNELFNFDTIKVSIPGLLYLVQNNLLFIALSNLDAAIYQVTYQLKILTTAFFSVALLNRKLFKHQITSLLLLTVGVAFVQLGKEGKSSGSGSEDTSSQSPFLGFVCVIMACMTSGFAGVYFEKILKGGRQVSLWIRNVQLGLFGSVLGLLGIILSPDLELVKQKGFFHGYTPMVWLVVVTQAFGGLMIAVVIKYADNILKGYATSVSIVLSSIISAIFLGFQISTIFVFGTGLVVCAVMSYGLSADQAAQMMPFLFRAKSTSVV